MRFHHLLQILNEMSGEGASFTLNWGNGVPGINIVFEQGTKTLSNEDGPAVELFYKNGDPKLIVYYRQGKLHRADGPAQQEFNEDGTPTSVKYFINGKEISKAEADVYKRLDKEDIQTVQDIDIEDF